MRNHRIAVIAGDGIGLEVIPVAEAVVEAAGRRFGFTAAWQPQPWGCAFYRETGRMMPADALSTLRASDAIFLGAVGDPALRRRARLAADWLGLGRWDDGYDVHGGVGRQALLRADGLTGRRDLDRPGHRQGGDQR